jgi:hypothetical protein
MGFNNKSNNLAMKQRILVRYANESHHSTIIELDITKLKDITKFPKEVFGTIDGVRIAILREEYEQAFKELQKQKLIEMMRLDGETGLYNIEE